MRVSMTLVLLAALLAVAGGCGQSSGDRKTVVLSYGQLSKKHEATLAALAKRFEKEHSDIRVVLHSLEPATDLQRHFYQRSFTARSAFVDVFEMDTIWTAELAAAGVLAQPPATLRGTLGEFEARTLDGARYRDKLIAVPAFPAVSVLYYRTDLLTRHGVSVPATWEGLQAAAKKIGQAEGIDGFVWQAAPYEGLVCNFLEYYRSHGGTIELLDDGVGFDAEIVETSLSVMAEMIKSGASSDAVLGYRERESRDRFLSGDAVFARDWDDLAGFVDGPDSDVSGKVGIAQLPGTSLHQGVPTLGGWHLAVNKASLALPEAWELVAFLTTEESQAFAAEELGRLPADLRVPLPVRAGMTGSEVVRSALAVARPRPMSPYYHELSVLLQRQVHDVLAGATDSAAGARAIAEGARKIELPEEAGPDFPRALLNPSTVF